MPHSVDSKRRFSDRVADYVLHRPSYPRELVAVLIELTGLAPDWVVADLGSGTGLSSQLFLENGNPVLGVEPNADMRRAGEKFLEGYATFSSVSGSAEATGLDAESVDLVVAAQAFHWFARPAARLECLRILREPRWAALVWNTRRIDADEFARGYEDLLVRYGTDYAEYRARRIEPNELQTFFGDAPVQRSLSNEQVFDFDGLRGRHLSSSYVPNAGHPSYEAMMTDLRRLFDAHSREGRVRFEYETQLFVGRVT